MIKVEVLVESKVYAKLFEEAQKRKKKPEELIALFVKLIITEDMVKAVLDDGK